MVVEDILRVVGGVGGVGGLMKVELDVSRLKMRL